MVCVAARAKRAPGYGRDACVEVLEGRYLLASSLVPMTGARDMVYDPMRNDLYVTTDSGALARYDLDSKQLLAPIQVGTKLSGADITADGKYLYVADPGDGDVRRVDLDTQQVTSFPWGSGIDLKIAADNMLFTGGLQVDLTSGSVTQVDSSESAPVSTIARSADRRTVLIERIYGGYRVAVYDAISHTFVSPASTTLSGSTANAVSRDGQVLWDGYSVFGRDMQRMRIFAFLNGGVAFSPVRDVMYGAEPMDERIVAYDTATWEEKYHLGVEEEFGIIGGKYNWGTMAFNGDGSVLFFTTQQGVRVFELPRSDGVAATAQIDGFPTYIRQGVPGSFTLELRDAATDPATTFRGTVHFSSTDPLAILPADYTFTAGDAGSHTFTATFASVGTPSISATVVGGGLTATQAGITVHAPGATPIPVAGQGVMIYDQRREMLYVPFEGIVQRYDLRTETLLPPWRLATNLLRWQGGLGLVAGDITPDGRYLCLTDSLNNVIQKVDLDSGRATTFSAMFRPWGIAIAANGKAMYTGYPFSENGLYQLDLVSGVSTRDLHNPPNWSGGTHIDRSPDHSVLMFAESDIMNAEVALYDPATDTYIAQRQLMNGVSGRTAVNHDGSLFAMHYLSGGAVHILDRSLGTVHTFDNVGFALAFDPVRDIFYGDDAATSEIIAYDTSTWREKYRLGVDGRSSSAMAVSSNGRQVFLLATDGIRILSLPQPDGQAHSADLAGFSGYIRSGVSSSFTLTFYDMAGEAARGFRGKVHFASSDPNAILPADYIFTAADAGSHSFAATLSSVGIQSITAAVAGTGLSANQDGISVHAAGTALVPVSGQQDVIYDPKRNMLYLPTSSGLLQRYNLGTETLLTPWSVGSSLGDAALTPDGRFLYISDRGSYMIQKVDLDTGQVTRLPARWVPWDIAIIGDKALFTGAMAFGFTASGLEVDQIDLTTDAVTWCGAADWWPERSTIASSADGRVLVFKADGDAPIGVYDVASGAATIRKYVSGGSPGPVSVSRDGALVAYAWNGVLVIADQVLTPLRRLDNLATPTAFDPLQDVFYATDPIAKQVVAYDTNTWQEKYRLSVGEDCQSITLSPDGQQMLLTTPSGVRFVKVPQAGGQTAAAWLDGFPSFVKTGTQGAFRLRFADAAGNPVTHFRGTVHFTSSDPGALLPADYTYTESDAGSHTFWATLRTTGLQRIRATLVGTTITASQDDIAVHAPGLGWILAGAADMVYDDTRGQLLITDYSGILQRYDLRTETLLSPISAGISLRGEDITPDGRYLYVVDGGANAVRKIDLGSEQVTSLAYGANYGEGYGWDLKIISDGYAYFTGQYNGPGWADFRRIDLGTDTISVFSSLWQNAPLARSADRQTIFWQEPMGSRVPIALYDATTDAIVSSLATNQSVGGAEAVSRNGQLVALSLSWHLTVLDRQLTTVQTFSSDSGGFAFDPQRDVFYIADSTTDEVIAYDSNTWHEMYRLAIGEDVNTAVGPMELSQDGTKLFLMTNYGIRVLELKTTDSRPTASLAACYVVQKSSSITLDGSDSHYPFGSISAYEWDFNYDGQSFDVDATGATPLFSAPTSAGVRQIALRVRAADGTVSDIATATLYVTNSPPTATFALVGPAVLGSDATVAFTNVAGEGSGFVYSYDFDNDGRFEVTDSPSAMATVPVSYLDSLGTHTVRGRVSDSSHASRDYTATFTVRAKPVATVRGTTAVVQGQTVSLLGGASALQQASGAVWEWDLDYDGQDFSVDVQGPRATLSTAAIPADTVRTVALRVRDGDGTLSDVRTLDIHVLAAQDGPSVSPTAVLLYSPQPEVHYGEQVSVNVIVTVPDCSAPLPSGTVTLKDTDGTVLGTATLVNGQTTFSVPNLPRGYHQLTATYNGDAVYRPLDSVTPLAVHVGAATVVDLLVLYTPGAEEEISSFGVNIKDLVYTAVADTNDALVNSVINLSLELVDVIPTPYVESGSLASDLERLSTSGDGYVDEAQSLRSSYGADLVCLFVADGDAGGLAYTMSSTTDPDNADWGYSVVVAGQSAGPVYTLAHELGHNFGAVHDVEHADGPGLYADSYGYRFTGTDGVLYHDIMSYDPGQTIPYYANPAVSYEGVPTGQSGVADVARTINASAPVVAAYEPTKVALVTPTKTTLHYSGAVGSQTPVTLMASVAGLQPNPHTPEGTVTFLDGDSVLGSATLTNGVAALTTWLDGDTPHQVRALYSNDDYFGDSLSPAITVQKFGVHLDQRDPGTGQLMTATLERPGNAGDASSITFTWKVNGTVRRTFTSTAAVSDSFDLSLAGNGAKGDVISVEVLCNSGAASGQLALDSVTVANTAPSVTPFAVTCSGDGAVAFAATDFAGHLSDLDAADLLQAIEIQSLPVHGTLMLGTRAVAAGETIPSAQLNSLAYIMVPGYTGDDYFTWTGSDGQAFSVSAATVAINGNLGPTDIGLSASSVLENSLAGTVVGVLLATDPNAGDTADFSLVPGAGSGNNGFFQIAGDELRTAATFDYEARSSYSIRVRVTDGGGLSYEEPFTITVSDESHDLRGSFGLVAGRMGISSVLLDANGDRVTFKLTGGGVGKVYGVDRSFEDIILTGTGARSVLTVSVKKAKTGDGLVTIENISSDGLIKSISGRAVVLSGEMLLNTLDQGPGRAAAAMKFRQLRDAYIRVQGLPISSIAVTGDVLGSRIVTSGSIGKLSMATLLDSEILVGVATSFAGDFASSAGDFANGTAKLANLTVTGRKLAKGSSRPADVAGSHVSAPSVGTVTLLNVADGSGPVVHVVNDVGVLKVSQSTATSTAMFESGTWKTAGMRPLIWEVV